MTERELGRAYGVAEGQLEGFTEAQLDTWDPHDTATATGVPWRVHAELRELRAAVDALALEVAHVREVLDRMEART